MEEEDSSDEVCAIVVHPLPPVNDFGSRSMKHTSKQTSDLRADQHAPPCAERALFEREQSIVEKWIDNVSHETEKSRTSSTRDIKDTRDASELEAPGVSERTHNNVLEEVPPEASLKVSLKKAIWMNWRYLLLLLLNMLREGIPSAVAGFQGALHLHTKIPLKSKT